MEKKEVVAIQPVCKTCDWTGEYYDVSIEGSVDYAKVSAVIETRLGHLLNVGGRHEIEYLEIQNKELV